MLLFNRLAEIMVLPKNWDSRGAPPISCETIARTLVVLLKVGKVDKDLSDPLIIPRSDGSIQLEWNKSGRKLEVMVSRREIKVLKSEEPKENETFEGAIEKLGQYFSWLAGNSILEEPKENEIFESATKEFNQHFSWIAGNSK